MCRSGRRSRYRCQAKHAIVRVGKRSLLNGEAAGTLIVTRHDGASFTMSSAKEGDKLEIEEAGPLRVVVKQSGVLASQDGMNTCCQYELRHTIVAGQPWILLRPTLIFTCDWPHEWLRGYGLELRTAAPIRELRSGADGVRFTLDVRRQAGQIVQAEDNILWGRIADNHAVEERRGEGFVQADAGELLTVAVRDFWQQHPAGFIAAGDRLTLKLWADESAGSWTSTGTG